jgi:tRNA(fMet)-specific endonuclease VapC
MTRFVFDTDTITLLRQAHRKVSDRALAQTIGSVVTSVITVDEQISGWYTALRRTKSREQLSETYDRLTKTVVFLSQFPILNFTVEAIVKYEELLSLKLGVRANDLRIAAIALVENATVVSRNLSDFRRVPNLNVENWAD